MDNHQSKAVFEPVERLSFKNTFGANALGNQGLWLERVQYGVFLGMMLATQKKSPDNIG